MRISAVRILTIACAVSLSPQVAAAQSDVAFPPSVYAARRARLMEEIGAPIVVPGGIPDP